MAIPVQLSTEIDAFARGRAVGKACRDTLRTAFAGYAELFAAHGAPPDRIRAWGERALAETAYWAPYLAEEIAGFADGAGLERWQLGALNGRTEVLAAAAASPGEGECSTAVTLLPGAAPRTVQTWDWHDTLRDGRLIWSLEPRAGHRVHTFTEVGVVGKIGVNSAGLGVHFNVLRHDSDHDEIGVPVHVVARRILDEASTVEEAIRLARSARLSASSVITVVTEDSARCLELCPAGVAELPVSDGFLVHTNHFLDPELAAGEQTGVDESSSSYDRLPLLRERNAELGAADRTRRARALHSHRGEGAPLCAHPDPALPAHERWETLATISLEVAPPGVMYVHEGGPCTVGPETWQAIGIEQEARETA
ncbi:C45 family autoproteolytic acyltransferase/hydolase [Amycolatopsis anabasis]|uniref:C45 family autoproteolytic acyltransferase/hydolase n=1 Tax=Amycolatopsis anabasis TaxID=1840409 RepID=UPI00131A79FF|nr:C45 family peptidase [Amycolatopsis anabasis]